MRLKPYFQLLRLPNLFTAAADPLSGWLLAGGSLALAGHYMPLAMAAMAIYAGGIALNDVFDLEVDRVERPSRPLPSGRISTRFAAALGVGLLGLGLLLAALGSLRSLGVAAPLVACVVGYDMGLKRLGAGPLVMGACRGLSLAMGAVAGPRPGLAFAMAVALAIFVSGITWISRSEAWPGRTGSLFGGWVSENLALAGLVALAWWPGLPGPVRVGEREALGPALGLVVLALVAGLVNRADWAAWSDPVPGHKQRAVKTGVLALVWLNVGVVAATRGGGPAFAVALLWIPAYVLARWLYTT